MSRVMDDSTTFDDKYGLDLCIKTGRLSCIYRCTHKCKGDKYVVKIIDYSRFKFDTNLCVGTALRDECDNYEKVIHKHISHVVECMVLSNRIVCLVYEFIEGNNLLVEIVNRANAGYVYSENVISYYMNQIMEAIEYCHKSGIIHGNIKPENILMAANCSGAPIKLCGFGRTLMQHYLQQSPVHYYTKNNIFNSLSNPYLAPELSEDNALFSKCSDIYSCGILLLTLLCGSSLHFDPQIDFFSIEEKIWNSISDIAKELVLKMLKPNANSRITAQDVLNHKWLAQKELYTRKAHLVNTIEEMRRYNTISILKKNISFICFTEKFDQNMNFKFEDKDFPLLVGVIDVFECLDKVISISSMNSRQDYIMDLILNDVKLNKFLNIFDLISKSIKEWKLSIPEFSAFESYEEVLNILKSLPLSASSDTIVSELLEILFSPYIQALMRTQDMISEIVVNESTYECSSDSNALENSVSSHEMEDNSCITPLRLVEFEKTSNEPMGITLKLDEWGRCVVSRVMLGGLVDRQGTLHVGDVIREINGIPVSNQSVESLQTLLKDSKGNLFSFKILSNGRQRAHSSQCETYFRAQFDYNPKDDDLIPSVEAGLTFNTGDILQVICKDDYYWWQSRKEGDKGSAGLIPSPELVEWRVTHHTNQKDKKDRTNCTFFGKKKKRDKYLVKRNALFDSLDIPSYEEVVYVPAFQRKTLVLLGAHGIGRRNIKNTLISHLPHRYSYPIPHTTRAARRGELNAKHYFFVSHEDMIEEIASNQYLEFGSHKEALYGTKIDTIRHIIANNQIPILDVEPQALKVLRSGEFSPFVVYIAAPNAINIEDRDGSLQRLTRESVLLQNIYKHLFDFSVVNNDIEETVKLVDTAFNRINTSSQWVPCTWIY